jgi:hypothetical protein
MLPPEVEIANRFERSVAISVLGGVEPTFGSLEEVPTDLFEGALREAILAHGPFSAVGAESDADYLLEVTVFPMLNSVGGGLALEQTLTTNWRLSRPQEGLVLLQEQVETSHESGALSGAVRMVRTTEGASRKNIKAGLELLSRLDLTVR